MSSLVALIFWACLLGVVVLAWWRGGAAEQIAASAVLGGALAVELIHAVLPRPVQAGALLLVEGALALTFLLTSMRYVRPWLGVAMVLEGLQFALHAYFFVEEKPHNYFYSLFNNLITIGVLLCVLIGTGMAWRRHAKAKGVAAK